MVITTFGSLLISRSLIVAAITLVVVAILMILSPVKLSIEKRYEKCNRVGDPAPFRKRRRKG
jgi:hypothetical protein